LAILEKFNTTMSEEPINLKYSKKSYGMHSINNFN